MKKKYNSDFKAKVVLEALKERSTTSELSSKYEVSQRQIQQWRKSVVDSLPSLFSKSNLKELKTKDDLIEKLYMQVGKLNIENEWLKKKL